MGKVMFGLSMSLDGFIADKNDDVSVVFAWFASANVGLHGASSVQQALKAGLLDEFHLNIAPVLLGEGVRLFDHLGSEPIHLERTRTLETPGATHLSFRVVK